MRLPARVRVLARRTLVLLTGLSAALGIPRVARGKVTITGTSAARIVQALGGTAECAASVLEEPALRVNLAFQHGPDVRTRPHHTVVVSIDAHDPRYSFRNNVALDHRGRVITEERILRDELPVSFSWLESVTRRSGTVAYLSNTNVGNFYHWMALTLPLVRVYREQLDLEPDAFYVGRPLTSWHRETLAMLGIPEERIISEGVAADRLVTAIQNRRHGAVDTPSLRFIREQLGRPRFAPSRTRRFVIGRGRVPFRRFVNEDECLDLLVGQYGFEYVTMDGKTIADEIDLFSSAEAIVGVHGAALTNLLWARPGCKVLELFPYGWNQPHYQEFAAFVGCRYGYIVGSPAPPRAAGLDKPDAVRRENDLLVEPGVLASAMGALDL